MDYNTNCGIYQITNKENGKMYIGSSVNISGRLARHKRDLKRNEHNNIKLQRAWNKHGETSFDFKIIIEVKREELLKVEQEIIDRYKNSFEDKLYNIAKNTKAPMLGQTSPNKGKKFSDKTRERMSKSRVGKVSPNKGKKASLDSRIKMSAVRKGKQSYTIFTKELVETIRATYLSGEYTQSEISKKFNISRTHVTNILNNKRWYCVEYGKLRDNFKNIVKPISEETRKKLSESAKGKKHSDETRRKLSESNTNKVAIVQLELNGVFVKKYNSASDANNKTNIDTSGIIKACKGKYKTAGGYKWMYLEEYEKLKSAN